MKKHVVEYFWSPQKRQYGVHVISLTFTFITLYFADINAAKLKASNVSKNIRKFSSLLKKKEKV